MEACRQYKTMVVISGIRRLLLLSGLAVAATSHGEPSPTALSPNQLTIGEAQTLPTHELAKVLLGQEIASNVIEAVRHVYDTSEQVLPEYVEFYTQPELTNPRLNGICRTDVITIEYNWADLDTSSLTDSDNPQPAKSLSTLQLR